MNRPELKYADRYPGLHPFDKGHSTIFFGREKEKKELCYQICLEKIVVLFGKSGLGKSSLLTAGVEPMLMDKGYLPIRLRFNFQKAGEENGKKTTTHTNPLLKNFIDSFDGFNELNKRKIISISSGTTRLREYIKAASFHKLITPKKYPQLFSWIESQRNVSGVKSSFDSVLITLVFICDQFEEFFNHEPVHQKEFLEQLSEVLHDEPPSRVLDYITEKEIENRTTEEIEWCRQPAVKVVFSLRSDRFASMQSLVPYISGVLRNRFELKPLDKDQATEAISGPAQKPDLGPAYIAPFVYEQTLLDKLVEKLGSDSNEIESSQLQIVCQYIEQKVKTKQESLAALDEQVVVDHSLLDLETEFPKILSEFYEMQLNKIENEEDRKKARLLIVDNLVKYGQRERVSLARIIHDFNISTDVIRELLNLRLIREEASPRGATYELSHDSLLTTVIASKAKRDESEKRIQEEKLLHERELEIQRQAEEARKRNEELEQKRWQLAKEVQLREEAERLKTKADILAYKLKRNSRIVILLVSALLIAGIVLIGLQLKYTESKKALLNNKLDTVTGKLVQIESTRKLEDKLDSLKNKKGVKAIDSARYNIAKEIYQIDSASTFTGKTDSNIYKVVDSLFGKDLYKENKNWQKPDNWQKVNLLKQYYNKRGFQFEKEVNEVFLNPNEKPLSPKLMQK